jgi:hypothetical protein
MLPLASILSEADAAALREEVLNGIRTGGKAAFGKLGTFLKRRPSVHFEQGPALTDALKGEPVPDVGALSKVISALVAAPPWTGIEVPGLFRAWVREKKRFAARDYLGREMWVGDEGLFFTVSTDPIDRT